MQDLAILSMGGGDLLAVNFGISHNHWPVGCAVAACLGSYLVDGGM